MVVRCSSWCDVEDEDEESRKRLLYLLSSGFLRNGLQWEFPTFLVLSKDFVRSPYQVLFWFPGRVCGGVSFPEDLILQQAIGLSSVSKNSLNLVVVLTFYLVRRQLLKRSDREWL